MILLLLGIAFLLATSSSLLVTSGSGRGDNGGNIPPNSNENMVPGEISGSVTVTAIGELWLTIFIDRYSVLAKIQVVDEELGALSYSFAIAGIMEISKGANHTVEQTGPEFVPITEFKTPEDAALKLIGLAKNLKLDISKESLKSVPFAIECGWRTPQECKQFIASLLEEKNEGAA